MHKATFKSAAIVLSCLFSIVFTGRNHSAFAEEQAGIDARRKAQA
ncbi:hypothetical protein ACFQZE_19135 [Paenibacillus sp. GCM10027627]